MLELMAHAPDDGWAFVRDGDTIFLLRPPYQDNRLAVRMEDVERAVTVHGYLATNLSFATERDLVQHLSDEIVRRWPPKEDPEALRDDLLRLADPGEIDVFLDEAGAWLRDGRVADAGALLNRLFAAEKLTHEHRRRIAALLEAGRAWQEARDQVKDTARWAHVASKFWRAQASGAHAQGAGGGKAGVLRPAA